MAMLITLVPTTNVSAASVAYMTEDPNADLYPFPLDMNFLSNYLYGSSENTKGNVATYYAKEVPKEWLPREMPASLKTGFWGKAGVHSTKAKVYFYPGTPSINYHKKRMELMSAEDSQVPVADSERSSMPAGSRGYILSRARTFISLMQETSKWIFRP